MVKKEEKFSLDSLHLAQANLQSHRQSDIAQLLENVVESSK
jgi:hypothetical protein